MDGKVEVESDLGKGSVFTVTVPMELLSEEEALEEFQILRGRQVLDTCLMAGISVPDRVAVLGVDNDELICSTTNPPMPRKFFC